MNLKRNFIVKKKNSKKTLFFLDTNWNFDVYKSALNNFYRKKILILVNPIIMIFKGKK